MDATPVLLLEGEDGWVVGMVLRSTAVLEKKNLVRHASWSLVDPVFHTLAIGAALFPLRQTGKLVVVGRAVCGGRRVQQ